MSTPGPLRLTAQFRDSLALAQAWMPFIKGGALFVQTPSRPNLGDSVFVLVNLDFLNQRYALTGQVVWRSAMAPDDGQLQGVGVQLGDDETARRLAAQITDALGNIQSSLKKTSTL